MWIFLSLLKRKTSLEVIDSNGQVLSKFCSSLKTQKTMTIHGKVIQIRVRISRKTRRTAFRASWKTSTRKLPKPYSGQCGRPYVEIAPQNMMRDIQLNEQRHRRARRLVGGTPVSRGEWPWIVQVRKLKNNWIISSHLTEESSYIPSLSIPIFKQLLSILSRRFDYRNFAE